MVLSDQFLHIAHSTSLNVAIVLVRLFIKTLSILKDEFERATYQKYVITECDENYPLT